MNHEGKRIIASVSGGKDSAAMCLHLRELGIPFEAVFADTGWEARETYDYISDVLEPRIGPITWLRSDVALPDDLEAIAQALEARLGHYSAMVRWCLRKAMFPSRVRRYCTDELKVTPISAYLAPMAKDAPWDVVNAVGIRAGESFARSQLPEWEACGFITSRELMAAWTWRPLREWSEADVVAIHKRHGLAPNPLYLRGASRVGCWPCIFARKAEVALVDALDPVRIEVIEELERVLTDRAKSRARERAEVPVDVMLDPELREVAMRLRDPDDPRQQRTFFGHGDKGRNWDFYGIRETIEWARTARGGRQMPMFSPLDEAAADGCMRWGMCETAQGGDDD
jgi:3'-phosphoadenosine 5'-phosphosulfate sulfotransferase (PAPS reductase)/FAD synthetase